MGEGNGAYGELLAKIDDGTCKVGVLGLGYVGLPLAIAVARHYTVVGYDISEENVRTLLDGGSYIRDVKPEQISTCLDKTFFPTHDPGKLGECEVLVITVPTPLGPDKEPDLSYVEAAGRTIRDNLRPGRLVVLESTTYPGTTEELLVPILAESGLAIGEEVFVAYSPERIDPGNQKYGIGNTPKIVGGMDQRSSELANAFYGKFVGQVVSVSNCRTAEAVKIVENIFREVNIALVNELALVFERMGIDTWEVIRGADTKPYGFMPFYPGPGVGGHCIPLDPYYLSYKARRYEFNPKFIELSGEINEFMKIHVINLADRLLESDGLKLRGANIAVLGLAYKRNIDDTRESPAYKIIEELAKAGAHVKTYDPFVKGIDAGGCQYDSEDSIAAALAGADCAIFVTDHDEFKSIAPEEMMNSMTRPLVVDCRNIFEPDLMKGFKYAGIGKPLPGR